MAIIAFLFWLVNMLLTLLVWAIIIQAILSWLFAFDIINHRNRFVNQLSAFLDQVVAPVLAPLRAFIPTFGGVDITPIIALLIIRGVQIFLLPAAETAAMGLFA
jgi:YggT family protein